jgi:hypothetical protein
MKNKLITALRLAAKSLEDGTFDYDWNHLESCNCGVLLCAMKGLSRDELSTKVGEMTAGIVGGPNWQRVVGTLCPITGIPTNELLRELLEAGLSAKDIVDLENLSNQGVLKRCDFGTKKTCTDRLLRPPLVKETPIEADCENSAHAAIYMRAWADLLVEEGKQDRVTQKVEAEPQPH